MLDAWSLVGKLADVDLWRTMFESQGNGKPEKAIAADFQESVDNS